MRDCQGDADELINIAEALTDDTAEFFNDQDSQKTNVPLRLRKVESWICSALVSSASKGAK